MLAKTTHGIDLVYKDLLFILTFPQSPSAFDMSDKPLSLPQTYRALVLTSTSEPLRVETRSLLPANPGSVVVQILSAPILSYAGDVYAGKRPHTFPIPFTPGMCAIGRLASIGPDATLLTPGQLVLINPTIRGRDDPSNIILFGLYEGSTEGARRLMSGEWRDGTFAEYAKVPLENCFALDEARLTGSPSQGGLGYEMERLAYFQTLMVPYGGLRDIGLQPGETVIISPATGAFGGAGILVALAMGAKVVAMGRNEHKLQRIKQMGEPGRVETVTITGDVERDVAALKSFGTVDAMLDLSPAEAAKSTHLKSGIMALRHRGRASLMGGIMGDVALPHWKIMLSDIQLKGKWMCEREDIVCMIQMVHSGLLKLDKVDVVGRFSLDEWQRAFEVAKENADLVQIAVINP